MIIDAGQSCRASTRTADRMPGMDRFDCRKKLWEDMRAAGLVIKEEPYTLNVPRSQRGGEIVEPMISTQWFVRIQPLAEAALEAVRDGRIRIVPERFTKVYYNWLENIQDWCISRQLWWGHRIPVWYCEDCGEDDRAPAKTRPHCAHCGSTTSAAGSGCAGYLVLLRVVAVLHPGLAGRNPRPANISTRPRSWKPATTSCSSGWRA